MHEISLLKHRNRELNTVFEETRLKLRKAEESQQLAEIGKEEAIASMYLAQEMSSTWEETVKVLRRQLIDQREQVKDQSFWVY